MLSSKCIASILVTQSQVEGAFLNLVKDDRELRAASAYGAGNYVLLAVLTL